MGIPPKPCGRLAPPESRTVSIHPPTVAEALAALGIASSAAAPGAPPTPAAHAAPFSNTKPRDYVKPAWFPRLELAARSGRGAALFGPAGTGKTSAIHALAHEHGASLITTQAFRGFSIDDLVGSIGLKDGATIFTPGPLAQALACDGWLLIEEANAAHPATLSKLNTLIDDSGDSCRLPDGSALQPGPGFRVFLCYNPGYAGMQEPNASLTDRLSPIYVDYLPPDQEAQILANRGHDPDTCKAAVALGQALRAARETLQWDCSPRTLAALLAAQTLDPQPTFAQAFEWVVLDRIGDPATRGPQRDLARSIGSTCVVPGFAATAV